MEILVGKTHCEPRSNTIERHTSSPSSQQIEENKTQKNKKVWSYRNKFLSCEFKKGAKCIFMSHKNDGQYSTFSVTSLRDQEEIKRMNAAIQEYAKNAPRVSRVLEVEDFIFAPYEGRYYRGIVMANEDNLSTKVFFVDTGEIASIETSQLVEPEHRIMKDHHLYVLQIRTNMHPKTQYMTDSYNWGRLLSEAGIDYVYIELHELVENAQQIFLGEVYLDKPSVKGSRRNIKQLLNDQFTFTEIGGPSLKTQLADMKTEMAEMKVSANLDHGAIVTVTHYGFYDEVLVTSVADEGRIKKLNKAIQHYLQQEPQRIQIPTEGQVVLAPAEDRNYYRAVIEGFEGTEDGSRKSLVAFLDRHGSTRLALSVMFNVNAEIAAHPIYTATLKLCGLDDIGDGVIDLTEDMKLGLQCVGQLELISKDLNKFAGCLWVANDRTWNCIVREAVMEKGNFHCCGCQDRTNAVQPLGNRVAH